MPSLSIKSLNLCFICVSVAALSSVNSFKLIIKIRFVLAEIYTLFYLKMSKLLLIDDQEDVRYSLQRIFQFPEIELAAASSLKKA